MTDPDSRTTDAHATEEPGRSWLRRVGSRTYKLLVDLGPIATLVAILLTNYQTCRGYHLAKEGSRAWLYPSDVVLLLGEPTRLQVLFSNAGSRPAQFLQHGGEILFPDDPSFRIQEYEGPTVPANGLLERGKNLGFSHSLGSFVSGKNNEPVRSMDQLLNAIRKSKRVFYIHGKLQYFDGVETYWLPYCKMLTADFGWQDCPPTSAS